MGRAGDAVSGIWKLETASVKAHLEAEYWYLIWKRQVVHVLMVILTSGKVTVIMDG